MAGLSVSAHTRNPGRIVGRRLANAQVGDDAPTANVETLFFFSYSPVLV